MVSRSRLQSNAWLKKNSVNIYGSVLSIGSLDDSDGEGSFYKKYFKNSDIYIKSEIKKSPNCDLILDVTNMKMVNNQEFDCIFCGGVLEHVFDFKKGIFEIHRVLKKNGILLLGLPFNQAIHMPPNDFWRFTEHGIRKMLSDIFIIEELKIICENNVNFPETYWVKAIRK
jgi:SAM-dependent methyltransferase